MKHISVISMAAAIIVMSAMSCGRNRQSTATADITRLDRIVSEFGDMDEGARDSIVALHGTALSDYLYMMGLRNGDLQSSIDSLAGSAAFAVFKPDVERYFTGEDSVKESLFRLNERLRKEEIIDYTPKYYAVISPYRQPIMLVDSAVFVAYNHYLGEGYEGYGSMPRYSVAVKYPGHIKYDVAEAIIDSENRAVEAENLSQRLLRDGALAYAVLNSVEDSSIGEYMGWTETELDAARKGERMAWERMAALNLLYSTDEMDARKLFDPSPATTALSPDLPGRMGRYLGLKIVESYVNRHGDATLEFLLSPEFYTNPQSLIESGYSPR